MKANGQLIFTRNADGSVTYEWKGGRRVAVTGEAMRALLKKRPSIGDVVEIGLTCRVVGLDVGMSASNYYDCYVVMREGWMARITASYCRYAMSRALDLMEWENRWMRRHPVKEGESIPAWSLAGIMLRPIL